MVSLKVYLIKELSNYSMDSEKSTIDVGVDVFMNESFISNLVETNEAEEEDEEEQEAEGEVAL